jgi:prepilin-type N-terminal cleavage/methylation domain-containing protein
MREMSTATRAARGGEERGFSLIEVMVAMSILLIGLLGLAQVFYLGLSLVGTSSSNLIAREKAREAIESVHTARDTHTITWAEIRNDAGPACGDGLEANGGGVFNNGALDLLAPGPDGLVNTDDDAGSEMTPGPDNIPGNADDTPLVGFTRQIEICDVEDNDALRQIVVTVRYTGTGAIGDRRREYRLTTFISKFS